MRFLFVGLLLLLPVSVAASDLGAPLGSSTGGTRYSPAINVIGQTAPTRVTTITPGGDLSASGPIGGAPSDGATRGPGELLIERRLDCFEAAIQPDRDGRNRFLTRCPGNQ